MELKITEHELVLNSKRTKVFYEITSENILVYTKDKHNLFTYSKPPSYTDMDAFRANCLEHFKKWVENDF